MAEGLVLYESARRALAAVKTESSRWQMVARLDEAAFEDRLKRSINAQFRAVRSAAEMTQYAEIVEAAARNPERFRGLLEEADRVKHVAGPYRKYRRMLDEDWVKALTVKPGRVRTLVMDPPWPWDMSGRASLDYVSMSLDAIEALPVSDWVEDDAHLWLDDQRARGVRLQVYGALGLRAEDDPDLGEAAAVWHWLLSPQQHRTCGVRRARPIGHQG
jgi:hypothetical protein